MAKRRSRRVGTSRRRRARVGYRRAVRRAGGKGNLAVQQGTKALAAAAGFVGGQMLIDGVIAPRFPQFGGGYGRLAAKAALGFLGPRLVGRVPLAGGIIRPYARAMGQGVLISAAVDIIGQLMERYRPRDAPPPQRVMAGVRGGVRSLADDGYYRRAYIPTEQVVQGARMLGCA